MTENEKQEAFDKWYDENYDEWAEGEEGIALREELEQAFKSGIAKLEKENAELKGEADSVLDNWCKGNDPCPHLKKRDEQLTNAKEIIKDLLSLCEGETDSKLVFTRAEQFLKDSEVEK